jgi:hypothetical protein
MASVGVDTVPSVFCKFICSHCNVADLTEGTAVTLKLATVSDLEPHDVIFSSVMPQNVWSVGVWIYISAFNVTQFQNYCKNILCCQA